MKPPELAATSAVPSPPTSGPLTRSCRSTDLAAIVALLLLATVLRVGRLSMVQYRYDDDALSNLVLGLARTGQLPRTGLTSTIALANGPFQVYLLAPFGWVGANPPLMTVGVAFLNILAVAIVYACTRDFFGRRAGLLALLLVAVNPWATILSRRLLGNDMVAPFAALSLWMLGRWLFRRDGRAAVVAGAALAIAGQVYVLGLECLAPAAVALYLAGRRLISRAALAGLVAFGVLFAPYLWTQVLPRPTTFLAVDSHTAGPAHWDLSSLRFALELATNTGYQAYAAQAGTHLDATSGLPAGLGLLARVLYLLGLAIGLWTVLRGPGRLREERRGIHVLLLTAFVVPVAVLLHPNALVRILYLVATYPLPYVYGALALDRLWTWSTAVPATLVTATLRRAVPLALGGMVTALVLVDLALAGVFFQVVGEYWPKGDYGIPWGLNDAAGREAVHLQQQLGAERILVLDDANDFNQVEWTLAEGGAPVGDFDDRRMLVLPGTPTVYLAPGDQEAQRTLLADYRQHLVREERWPGAGVPLRYYFLPPRPVPLLAGAVPLGWDAGGLLQLDSVSAPRRVQPGQSIDISVSLSVLAPPGPQTPNYSVYVHLLGFDGKAVAQVDETTFATQYWHTGDHILQHFSLVIPSSAPPGVLNLALGIYSAVVPGPAIRPLQLHTASGQLLGSMGMASTLAIAPPPASPPAQPLVVRFARGVTLEGYDLRRNGTTLTVTPHWSATAVIGEDYTAFVHLLDASGHLVAQHDGPPLGGHFPTSAWQPGDRIADPHPIALPAALPPGAYGLEFGLYDSHTLQRLAVLDGMPEAEVRLP